MKSLPDVTLLAISSIRLDGMVTALRTCMSYFNFGEVKLVTNINMSYDGIKVEYCPPIRSTYDFDCYAFLELGKHVNTSHMLMVQDHGYIIHPEVWDDEWLSYDYIGAPWPIRDSFISPSTGEMVRVGNGGFSLRSKKLLDLPKKLNLPVVNDRGFTNDDGLVNVYYRKTFIENGINYAPVEVAAKFSFENYVEENKNTKTFGFHRFTNNL